ncbi:hypothetical protein RIR_jg39730.t1 [Rhizophagus irregularis DAOM 181602=DAOM 197198]|uniref:Uncharacterized protein n=1 Tax=Rhizophagus irregularis (strain DAOM 197198w) TaxID=1432141 RepID=A0A015JV05_RHIIW|nr:hypothetical protein RirG_193190 [Rhizophagus irregularis DAOM 197198w]GBC20818.1 hypothetical protein RIR_jg39730.t1 [Rhizophagus irregularis DAOM 181602=DAOM 197198]
MDQSNKLALDVAEDTVGYKLSLTLRAYNSEALRHSFRHQPKVKLWAYLPPSLQSRITVLVQFLQTQPTALLHTKNEWPLPRLVPDDN